jgi:hypothetical protein
VLATIGAADADAEGAAAANEGAAAAAEDDTLADVVAEETILVTAETTADMEGVAVVAATRTGVLEGTSKYEIPWVVDMIWKVVKESVSDKKKS